LCGKHFYKQDLVTAAAFLQARGRRRAFPARRLGRCHSHVVAILSRRGKDLTCQFRQVAAAVAALTVRSCVLDGELTMLDSRGVPDFKALMFRRGSAAVCVWVFDLLELNGRDMRGQPLMERKQQLTKLLRGCKLNLLKLSASFDDGERLLEIVEEMGLEGIVSKRKDLAYRSGTLSGWIKVKCAAWRETNAERGRLFELT
jgi:bifunctional non-homologous end joining protein LigD